MTHLQIDVVSDVVCPWCYIGKRRLEQALDLRPDVEAAVSWRPFQLDPTIPPEGIERRTYLQRKFGTPDKIAEIYDRVGTAGAAEGIHFAFDRIERSPNTLDAHRLLRWAATAGVQNEVAERLFQLYFLEGTDIGDRDVLVATAEEAGMDADLVASLMEDGADRDRVEQEIALAQKIGITGVPCFVLDNKFLVMGAQDASVIAAAIDRALDAPPEDVA